MKKERGDTAVVRIALMSILTMFFVFGFASAGLGIYYDEESKLVEQGGEACLTYSVYNPWPDESFVEIRVSEDLKEVLRSQTSETKLVPAQTPSEEAIPIEFCFNVPYVYEDERNCLLGNFLCEQTCEQEQKVFEGQVLATEVADPFGAGGAGGSATAASIAAPLRLKVVCNEEARNYKPILIVVAVILVILIIWLLIRRHKNKQMNGMTSAGMSGNVVMKK